MSPSSTRAQPTSPLDAACGAGGVHENPSHGFGGGGEEVPPAVPAWGEIRPDEAEVRLVNEGRGLERMARLLLRELMGRELA